MSAKKKSFDLERKSAQPSSKKKVSQKTAPRQKRATSLRERREAVRRMKAGMLSAFIFLLIGGAVYTLWRPEVRVSEIRVAGEHYEAAIEAIAQEEMSGSYYYLFPRDSFFFYPERTIEEAIRSAFPEVKQVSMSRMSFTSLAVELEERTLDFLWCGLPEEEKKEGECYEADREGYIFKRAEQQAASSSEMLRVYALLDTASTTDRYPLRARVLGTDTIDEILTFSRSIEALGTPLSMIAIRNDEADVYSEGGTRITYVVGGEREAMENARAALPKLNLMDGSVEYVDLRFPGKVYVKRSGEQ